MCPVYLHDIDQFDKLKNNIIYQCDIKQANNPEFHAKVFGIAATVCGNLPENSALHGIDAYQLIKATEIELGYIKWITKLNGEKYPEPESISFDNWDNIKRSEFYSKALPIWSALIGVSQEALESNYL
jgi:hypothetical protein